MPKVKGLKTLGFFNSTKTLPCDISKKWFSITQDFGINKLSWEKKCSDSSKSSSTITSTVGANHGTNISHILSTKHRDSSPDAATELNPADPNPSKRKATRGSNALRSYTVEFQVKIIHEMPPVITQDELVDR